MFVKIVFYKVTLTLFLKEINTGLKPSVCGTDGSDNEILNQQRFICACKVQQSLAYRS